jgi:hypothetical protein
VAFGIEDVAVLRACGIPATLATGLGQLDLADLGRLCDRFRLERRKSRRLEELELSLGREGDEIATTIDTMQQSACGGCGKQAAHDERSRIGAEPDGDAVSIDAPIEKRLVLVRWSPAALDIEPPAAFDAVSGYFKELKRHLGLELFDVYIWLATFEDVDRLRFLMRHREVVHVEEALLDCLYDGLRGLEQHDQAEARQMTVPRDFPAAVLILRNMLLADRFQCDRVQRRHEALRHVERLLHEQVIEPLMNEVMKTNSATERAIGLAATQLVQMFLNESVAINMGGGQSLSEAGIADFRTLPLERIKVLLALGDRVTKFVRELDRCKQTTGNGTQLTRVPQPKLLNLLNSD